ncbi:unnamed protein product, partial [Aureobasidium mustum]
MSYWKAYAFDSLGWQNANNELQLMLQLRISIRVSKRRKILDHYLLPPSDTCVTASTSIVHLRDASENIRQCLEEAYGKFSTQKCLRIPFHQPKPGRVLVPIAPDSAPCLGGTALHLLTLLHSLSCASSFEIFLRYSSYAHHALANIEGVLADSTNIDLLTLRRQLGCAIIRDEHERAESNHAKATISAESCIPGDQPMHAQPICSPPPYSPPPKTANLPKTPKKIHVVNENSDLINRAGCLKRSHACIDPEPDFLFTKSARPQPISCSPTSNDTPDVAHDAEKLSSLREATFSPTIVNTPSTVEDTHMLPSEDHTPLVIKAAQVEGDDSFAGQLLSVVRNTSPSILSTPGRSDTLSIKPTIFTKRDELPRYSVDAEKVPSQVQDQDSRNKANNLMSTSTSSNTSPPKPTMRSLHQELRMLVSAKVPLLTAQALQRIIDDLLESLDYNQKVAEIGLQETSDDLKVELQLEKDKSLEDIDAHSEHVFDDVKCQMEDLANGHLLAFEDMLQRTGEQLKQTLKAFLLVLAKAMLTGKLDDDAQTANMNATNAAGPQEEDSLAASNTHSANFVSPGIADSPAITATKLFLHEFGSLCTSAKVEVLERLASQNTAEIFLTVDKGLREAWVASWTGQVPS